MKLEDFMEETFPDLVLRPPLFYNWPIGIRFELGMGWKKGDGYPESPYLLGCYKRAITLFEALHSPSDDIVIVMDVHDFKNGRNLKRELKNFSPYVEKALLYRLKHQEMPFVLYDDDEVGNFKTHRFTLACRTSEVKYKPLLIALCNSEIGIGPAIYHRVYFVNLTKKTIFHVYDDRGCDLVAASRDSIRMIYKRYNDWILDYDRFEIDQVFS